MKKYAKIENEETKECSVGLGTNAEFYKSIGMIEMDVEQAYNGSWYVVGYTPEKPQEVCEEEVRKVRNNYLEKYVDPYQLVIRWEDLSDLEQEYLKEYRQYLLDYTKEEDWYEQNPNTYEEWLIAHHPVTEESE